MLRLAVIVADRVRHFDVPRNLRGALTIGSAADNDFVIVCPGVSRRHATLERVGDRILLKDAGSKNGIVIRGHRQELVQLVPGEAVRLGRAQVALEEVSTSDVLAGVVLDARSSSHGGNLAHTTASASESAGAAAALRWARAAENADALGGAERRRLLEEALAIGGADAVVLCVRTLQGIAVREVFGLMPAAGEIDEIRLFLAPLVLGGRTARDPLEGEGVEAIADAVRALSLDCERIGEDLLVSARIKEW